MISWNFGWEEENEQAVPCVSLPARRSGPQCSRPICPANAPPCPEHERQRNEKTSRLATEMLLVKMLSRFTLLKFAIKPLITMKSSMLSRPERRKMVSLS